MSDRYAWNDDSQELEPELDALLRRHAEAAYREVERVAGHEASPLSLTKQQAHRLWLILSDEVGPISASKILKRIQTEV